MTYKVSTSQFNGKQLPCVRDEEGEIVAAGCTAEDAALFAAAPRYKAALEAILEAGRLSDESRARYCAEIAGRAL